MEHNPAAILAPSHNIPSFMLPPKDDDDDVVDRSRAFDRGLMEIADQSGEYSAD